MTRAIQISRIVYSESVRIGNCETWRKTRNICLNSTRTYWRNGHEAIDEARSEGIKRELNTVDLGSPSFLPRLTVICSVHVVLLIVKSQIPRWCLQLIKPARCLPEIVHRRVIVEYFEILTTYRNSLGDKPTNPHCKTCFVISPALSIRFLLSIIFQSNVSLREMNLL